MLHLPTVWTLDAGHGILLAQGQLIDQLVIKQDKTSLNVETAVQFVFLS